MTIVAIAGSPSANSRSTALLNEAGRLLHRHGVPTLSIAVRELPAEDLVFGRCHSASVKAAGALIDGARAVILATPVYKAAYSGLLKTFLDLLGQNLLEGKMVFPIAVGGDPAHMLAIDYSLRPVLAALGASHVLPTLYATDAQIALSDDGGASFDADVSLRLRNTVYQIVHGLPATDRRSPHRPALRKKENAHTLA